MTTTYLVVTGCIVGNPTTGYQTCYNTTGIHHADRQKAINAGIRQLGHDDFGIATITDGKLTAFGYDMTDWTHPDDWDPLAVSSGLCIDLDPGVKLTDRPEIPQDTARYLYESGTAATTMGGWAFVDTTLIEADQYDDLMLLVLQRTHDKRLFGVTYSRVHGDHDDLTPWDGRHGPKPIELKPVIAEPTTTYHIAEEGELRL